MNSSVFDFLLTATPVDSVSTDFAAEWARHRARSHDFANSIDRAAIAGFDSAGTGPAFLGGYQEALHALVPSLDPAELSSMCATETAGARPSTMTTTVDEDGAVSGTKSFATLGAFADRFLVIARSGTQPDGRPILRAVLVPAGAAAAVSPLPTLPFAPEIPHAEVAFDAAPGEVLPGDGYADYLKPFRTVEDLHVVAAVLGQLVRVARLSQWPAEPVEQLLALFAAVRGVGGEDPSSPGVHIALGGLFDRLTGLRTELEPLWAPVDPEVRKRWERDVPLLGVAGKVRAARLATAWRALA
ncbi:acyl-CoA dehydrogenase [Nocardia sp. PE-7]|uniref:acyl-CoA dehydrogenase family protein n=1 Tax=Nocardia sp. PE-7 TaxID=3058426 RepID=UPI002657D4ED|nr:acyl-CoA dehydrogenase family protein [Nocardia sp. PE-7]WKG09623.1 acyl-CoA dehydrogenase [Nocardia sp. PE-7]